MEGFDFMGADDFDEQKIAFEMVAKIMAPMFRALTKEGLSGQEAAALVAAYMAQTMPQPMEDPPDGK